VVRHDLAGLVWLPGPVGLAPPVSHRWWAGRWALLSLLSHFSHRVGRPRCAGRRGRWRWVVCRV